MCAKWLLFCLTWYQQRSITSIQWNVGKSGKCKIVCSYVYLLLGMAGRLGSVRTINQSAYAWPLQRGGFKVVRVLKWELRAPRTKVPSISKWKPELSQDWVLNQVKHHFCICYWSGNHRTSPDHGRSCRWKEKVSRKLWLSIIYHKHTFNLDSRMQWISALTSSVPGCWSQLFC